jgi:hypothetical protein
VYSLVNYQFSWLHVLLWIRVRHRVFYDAGLNWEERDYEDLTASIYNGFDPQRVRRQHLDQMLWVLHTGLPPSQDNVELHPYV